jgi:hypothetical protein
MTQSLVACTAANPTFTFLPFHWNVCCADQYNPYVGSSSCRQCSTCRAATSGPQASYCPALTSTAGDAYCTIPWIDISCSAGRLPVSSPIHYVSFQFSEHEQGAGLSSWEGAGCKQLQTYSQPAAQRWCAGGDVCRDQNAANTVPTPYP